MKNLSFLVLLISSIFLFSCNGKNGEDGLNRLSEVAREASGDNCSSGGWRIESGLDGDADGILDPGEIDSTRYVCNNASPVANAGNNQAVITDSIVYMDGADSSDDDYEQLTYAWSMDSRPATSSAALSFTDVKNPSFLADRTGNYIITLKVTDPSGDSHQDTVTVEAFVPSGEIPDTGQIGSYTIVFGEDSDYTIDPPDLTIDTLTATDANTGLTWQRALVTGGNRTWSEAGSDCSGSTVGGQTDWRLPTIKELHQLVDMETSNPVLNETVFGGTNAASFWSSTTHATNTSNAWYEEFRYGDVDNVVQSAQIRVRCVRGTSPDNDFFDAGITIVDKTSGLEWEKQDEGQMAWESAISHCEQLSFRAKDDWRLPTSKELQSIVDYTKTNPAIDRAYFPDTESSNYWTSTTSQFVNDFAFYVNFADGSVKRFVEKTEAQYVRCVRHAE